MARDHSKPHHLVWEHRNASLSNPTGVLGPGRPKLATPRSSSSRPTTNVPRSPAPVNPCASQLVPRLRRVLLMPLPPTPASCESSSRLPRLTMLRRPLPLTRTLLQCYLPASEHAYVLKVSTAPLPRAMACCAFVSDQRMNARKVLDGMPDRKNVVKKMTL